MTLLLGLIFFLSGLAALLFETLWFHQLGLLLGNSIWASSLVLAGFMGGLALGNALIGASAARVRQPLRWYAALEVIIGVTGAALVWLLPYLTPALLPALRPLSDTPWLLNAVRLLVGGAALLIPATAMGATLPLLVAALLARLPSFGAALGWLYGWNTWGAVAGALVGEAWLIERCGIRGTALAAAGANALAAVAALTWLRAAPAVPAHTTDTPTPLPPAGRRLLLATALCGGILLALEVVWFRLELLFADASSWAFALMLAVVLAGMALGGWSGGWWLRRTRAAAHALPALALLNGVVCVLTYLGMDLVLRRLGGYAAIQTREIAALALMLMLPTAWGSGVLFTWIGAALHAAWPGATRATGWLTCANTAGAMLGSLAAAFVLLPWLGVERALWVCAALYGVVAWLTWQPLPGARRVSITLVVAAVGWLLALAAFPHGWMTSHYLATRLREHLRREHMQTVVTREGLTETIIYLRRDWLNEPLYYRLLTNSHSMSATMLPSLRYMKLYVYLPVALHPRMERALLLCYGVGGTAKALTDTAELAHIDVVDTSKDILALSDVVYPDPREHPLRDPRVQVHVEDGRFFLQTTTQRYDLITGEPPPPKHAGVVNLYTREYFALAHDRLAPGGYMSYWLPVHALADRDARAIIRAFCDVFEDCSLWAGARFNWMLLGSREATGPVTEAQFTRQWRDPRVAEELRALGLETPEQLGALFMRDAGQLRALTQDVPPLTDDFPKRLSHAYASEDEVRETFRPWMDTDAARARFAASVLIAQRWPAAFIAATQPYFDAQHHIERFFCGDTVSPVDELPVIHRLLTTTSLETLPLWLLGSYAEEQRIVDRVLAKGVTLPMITQRLGLRALAARRYSAAADYFTQAAQQQLTRTGIALKLYALCQAGRRDEAAAAARTHGLWESTREENVALRTFLQETCGLTPSSP